MNTVSRRYARALFELAQDNHAMSTILKEIKIFIDLKNHHDTLKALFVGFIKRQEAMDVINSLSEKLHFSSLFKKFLMVLAKARRLDRIEDIYKAFQNLYDHAHDIIKVDVITAYPLSPEHEHDLKYVLSEKFKKTVSLNPKVDSSLLGGMMIYVGSYCLDTSLKTTLKTLETLIKG